MPSFSASRMARLVRGAPMRLTMRGMAPQPMFSPTLASGR